ncbi:hypothetical protein F8388_023055 [Cannabis sativa]|uniref:Uncharacterized protein n=1 Tax=Cannabis sativa TaxID=3483 RepID=A0A7J6FES2_CANSA|nr:hypothetical protein F8388_023055 [Cannabis sativa]
MAKRKSLDEASFIRDIVEDISSQLSNVMPPKVVESLIIPWIRSAFGVVRALFLLVFLFLVVFPLFGYFFFNVVVPVIEYVLGVDQGTHSSSYCDITIDGKTTRQYGSDCGSRTCQHTYSWGLPPVCAFVTATSIYYIN